MASKKQTKRSGTQLPLPAEEDGGVAAAILDEIVAGAKELAARIAGLPLNVQVDALNRARAALHEASPFREEPVDLVLWVRCETVDPNDYNPNRVAPPEMQLLRHSIEVDGYTQPIVTSRADTSEASAADTIGDSETVDGFHRGRCGKEVEAIHKRVRGYLPITRVRGDRAGRGDRIASTIRHNRARGEHGVSAMSEIVRMLYLAGWPDDRIQKELGMQLDEVVRLKQVTGLAALFADRDFSEAWEPDENGAASVTPTSKRAGGR